MPVIEVDLGNGLPAIGSQSDVPLRPRASTRGSRSHSYRSTPTELSPLDSTLSYTPSSGPASPISGKARTLAGTDRRWTSGLSSRDYIGAAFTKLDFEMLRGRLTSRDLTAEPQEMFDDSVLEPRPYERVKTNLSEIITARPGPARDSIDLTGFGGHRDTFAILGIRRKQRQDIELPAKVFRCLLRYIDFETYLAVRLACRSWSTTISQVRPPQQRAVRRIPVEILEKVYYYMSPMDFNAARYTCRAWMAASLETRLLTYMLKRGGWWAAAVVDLATIEEGRFQSTSALEWLLSKRLATECSLRPDWTGNGLTRILNPGQSTATHTAKPQDVSQSRVLKLSCEIDFSELENGSRYPVSSHPLQLSASTCGRYLLAFKDRSIFIFYLGGDASIVSRQSRGGPQALKRIQCPQRVLAVTMSTTSGSYSLVALLEGRLGVTCNLTEGYDRRPSLVMPKVRVPEWTMSTYRQPSFLDDEVELELPLPLSSFMRDNSVVAGHPRAREEFPLTFSPKQYDNSPSSPLRNVLHRDLCSAENPPLSVAICPQQQCIAFGSSTGIELHWVDSVSGEKLNRWFASDRSNHHLCFLPSRPDDTARKLRLVSSPAPPYLQFALLQKLIPAREVDIENETLWNSMSDLGFHDSTQTRDKPVYYNMKPCSDGWHMLFIDAEAENVCLGLDKRDGESSEEGLSKIAAFLNPKNAETDLEKAKPTCFAAATETAWGLRVVVGYDDGSVHLFIVPSDIFQAGRGGEHSDWLQNSDASGAVKEGGSGFGAVWPVEVRGTKIGYIDDLADVAIQGEGGGVRVWAFSSRSRGFSWSLGTEEQERVKICKVLNDPLGLRVEHETDEEGDWQMSDAPPLSQYSGLDGTAYAALFVNTITHPRREALDVSMYDVDEDEGYFSAQDDDPATALTVETPPRSHKRLHNTPLHRSDVSMQDVSEVSSAPAAHYQSTSLRNAGYNANKRRRLNNTPSRSVDIEKGRGDQECGFDPDRETIEWLSSAFAISVPSRERRWSGGGLEGEDWVPDYLGMGEEWDEQKGGEEATELTMDEMEDRGLDLWNLARQAWDVDIL